MLCAHQGLLNEGYACIGLTDTPLPISSKNNITTNNNTNNPPPTGWNSPVNTYTLQYSHPALTVPYMCTQEEGGREGESMWLGRREKKRVHLHARTYIHTRADIKHVIHTLAHKHTVLPLFTTHHTHYTYNAKHTHVHSRTHTYKRTCKHTHTIYTQNTTQ